MGKKAARVVEKLERQEFSVDTNKDQLIMILRQENEQLRHELRIASMALAEIPMLRKQVDEFAASLPSESKEHKSNGKKVKA